MLGIGYFTWWNLPRRAWYIILAELVMILFLASSLVMEYLYNVYFHNYVDSLSPILVPLGSVAFGVSSATIAIRLYMGMRSIQATREEVEVPVKRRTRSLGTRRKTTALTVPPQNPPAPASLVVLKKSPEPKLDVKPAPGEPGPANPATQPSPAKTGVPPRAQPEKDPKPPPGKAR